MEQESKQVRVPRTRDNVELVAALDIGTSKTRVALAELATDGEMNLIGVGQYNSSGLQRGVVVNIEDTVRSIQMALEEAALMAGRALTFRGIEVSITGLHVMSTNSTGRVNINPDGVTINDIHRALEIARAVSLPTGNEILHVRTQEYVVDEHLIDSREPIGIMGKSLKVNTHLVSVATTAVQNIEKCVRRCGLEPDGFVLQSLAAAQSVLTEDEKRLGVALINLGAGVTEIALFYDGAIRATKVLEIAGEHFTKDLAVLLRVSLQEAEDLKIRFGAAKAMFARETDAIELRQLAQKQRDGGPELVDILEARAREWCEEVVRHIRSNDRGQYVTRAVLTGGGAQLAGLAETLTADFGLHTRVGVPHYHGSLAELMANPSFATLMGLLEEAAQTRRTSAQVARQRSSLGFTLGKIKNWLMGNDD
jgi:cell division protein FtsA